MKNTLISRFDSLNNYRETLHFAQRAVGRHLDEDQVLFALLYGTRMYCSGVRAHVVRRQDIPTDIDAKLARRYHGMVVMTTLDGYGLVTVYQNPHAYTNLKKKYRN
jgi:hypothetical protein